MKQFLCFHIFLFFTSFNVSLPFSFNSYSWGERGHHTIGTLAARSLPKLAEQTQKEKNPNDDNQITKHKLAQSFARFISDRAIMLGHLSNIPDHSWRNGSSPKNISQSEVHTHFFEVEPLLGPYEGHEKEFTEQLKTLPLDYNLFKKKFNNQKNKISLGLSHSKVRIYKDTGASPWRAQQFHDLIVSAFQCVLKKQKTPSKKVFKVHGTYPRVPFPFQKWSQFKKNKSQYNCSLKTPIETDLYAAVIAAGVLSHYIGDQAQPYHSTVDYDGWATGNGGIHVYFESLVLDRLPENLVIKVSEKITNPDFQKKINEKITLPLSDKSDPNAVVKMMFDLAADSLSYLKELKKIDDATAIITPSSILPLGARPQFSKKTKKGPHSATRKDPGTPEVTKAFEDIAVERLATGAYLLSQVIFEAWQKAGEPDLSSFNAVSLPYAHDVIYLWPNFN